jgi:hypothetical protein
MALPGFTSTLRPATTAVARREALRSQDVGELAILILHQRDEGGAVGIIFEPLDGGRLVPLATLEVDIAVRCLWPPAIPREVTWPLLLRPPVLRLPSVRALSGLPFQSDDLSTRISARCEGVVGLYCLSAILQPQIPVVTSMVWPSASVTIAFFTSERV